MSHWESGGRDHVSDFTINLIKEFLLDYMQDFARKHLRPRQRHIFHVKRGRFNYGTSTWESRHYELPSFGGDYVLLTPRNLLTRDETWINRDDLINHFETITESISNAQLRAQINNYFYSQLSKKSTRKERLVAASAIVEKSVDRSSRVRSN